MKKAKKQKNNDFGERKNAGSAYFQVRIMSRHQILLLSA
jgi:hypothetical protein